MHGGYSELIQKYSCNDSKRHVVSLKIKLSLEWVNGCRSLFIKLVQRTYSRTNKVDGERHIYSQISSTTPTCGTNWKHHYFSKWVKCTCSTGNKVEHKGQQVEQLQNN